MVEQVRLFSFDPSDNWNGVEQSDQINKFLTEKRDDGAEKQITRVFQTYDSENTWLLITIFYQWVKGEPDLGPFRTAPKGE